MVKPQEYNGKTIGIQWLNLRNTMVKPQEYNGTATNTMEKPFRNAKVQFQ